MLPACTDASEAVPRHGANEVELQKRGDGSNQGAQNEPDAPCTPDCVSTAALGARDQPCNADREYEGRGNECRLRRVGLAVHQVAHGRERDPYSQ